jgi:hypothetical protein
LNARILTGGYEAGNRDAALIEYSEYTKDELPDYDKERYDLFEWLKADLAKYQGLGYWIIVYVHYPIFCSFRSPDINSDHCKEYPKYIKDRLVQILNENGVNLVLAGHVHGFEITRPYIDGEPGNTTHVICGTGGMRYHPAYLEGKEWHEFPDTPGEEDGNYDTDYYVHGLTGYCDITADDDVLNLRYMAKQNVEDLSEFSIRFEVNLKR